MSQADDDSILAASAVSQWRAAEDNTYAFVYAISEHILVPQASGGARVLDQGGKQISRGRQTSDVVQIGSYHKLLVTLFVKLYIKK